MDGKILKSTRCRDWIFVTLVLSLFVFANVTVTAQSTLIWDEIAVNHAGTQYAVASNDGSVAIYDTTTQMMIFDLAAHTSEVVEISWSFDDTMLATGGYDNTLNIWDMNTGTLMYSFDNYSAYIISITWYGDNNRVIGISGPDSYELVVWDLETQQSVFETDAGVINDIQWKNDAVALTGGTSISAFNSDTFQALYPPSVPSDLILTNYFHLVWHPTANIIAAGTTRGDIHLWNIETQTLLAELEASQRTQSAPLNQVRAMAFSLDGQYLSSISGDGLIRVFDWASGTIINEVNLNTVVSGADWTSDGTTVVYSPNDPGAVVTLPVNTPAPQVTSFSIIDPTTNSIIQPLTDGDFLYLDDLTVSDLVVRANTTPATVGSVEFTTGQIEFQTDCPPTLGCDTAIGQVGTFVDNTAPYDATFQATTGRYSVSATPYTQADATGESGDTQSVSFIVEQSNDASIFTLVDASTDSDIAVIQNGDVFSTATVGSDLNVRADVTVSGARSVVFSLNGIEQRIDNNAPYALANEQNGDYGAWSFTSGASYRLIAEVYSNNNGNGTLLATYVIHFSIE